MHEWLETYTLHRRKLIAQAAKLVPRRHAEDIVQDAAEIALRRGARRFSWYWGMMTARRIYLTRHDELTPTGRASGVLSRGVAQAMQVSRVVVDIGERAAHEVACGEASRYARRARGSLEGKHKARARHCAIGGGAAMVAAGRAV